MDQKMLDIRDPIAVKEVVCRVKPVLILNCAAFTRVDDCEAETVQAEAVNGAGPGHLAEAAKQVGAMLVHFSTDYVFDGTQETPYDETALAHPLSVYGASKWNGECRVRECLSDHLIIRTQWLYGKGGRHFVGTILNLAERQTTLSVVNDQIGSPTWTEDVSEATLALIQAGARGTYHLVNAGHCSWYDFACRILREAGREVTVTPCTTAAFPRPARRPACGVLATAKAEAVLGRGLPPWDVALRRFIRSV
jgi:dTDP-4-dehydrorhamnose reductase